MEGGSRLFVAKPVRFFFQNGDRKDSRFCLFLDCPKTDEAQFLGVWMCNQQIFFVSIFRSAHTHTIPNDNYTVEIDFFPLKKNISLNEKQKIAKQKNREKKSIFVKAKKKTVFFLLRVEEMTVSNKHRRSNFYFLNVCSGVYLFDQIFQKEFFWVSQSDSQIRSSFIVKTLLKEHSLLCSCAQVWSACAFMRIDTGGGTRCRRRKACSFSNTRLPRVLFSTIASKLSHIWRDLNPEPVVLALRDEAHHLFL